MRKTLMVLGASTTIAAAGLAAPTPTDAHAWWVAPAIIGGAVVAGAAIVGGAAAANPYYYGSPYYGPAYYEPTVTVRPACRIVREQTPYGWRSVRVC